MLIFFLKVNAKFYIVKVKFAIVFNFHFDVFNAFKSATFTLTFDQNVNICIYIVTLWLMKLISTLNSLKNVEQFLILNERSWMWIVILWKFKIMLTFY